MTRTHVNLHRSPIHRVHTHTAVYPRLDSVTLEQASEVLFVDIVSQRTGDGSHLVDDSAGDDAGGGRGVEVLRGVAECESGEGVPGAVPVKLADGQRWERERER